MMEFRLIDVVSIISKVPRSQFEEVKLAQLAESILECEGVLTPPVLKVIGLDSYEVIEGDREYYAAVVAREKNPRQGEMINAFVVPPKYEENIRKQLAVLHRGESTPMLTVAPITAPLTAPPELAELAKKFDHFQQVVKSQFDKNEHSQAQLLAAVNQDRIEAKETQDKICQQLVLIETLVKGIKEAPAMVSPSPSALPFQPDEPLPSDCNDATVKRLQAEAKKWKIKYSGMRKPKLIEALKQVGAC